MRQSILNFINGLLFGCFILIIIQLYCSVSWADSIIVDHNCTDLKKIPQSAILKAKETLHIAYGHTSHGSQLISGMTGLDAFMTKSPKYGTPVGLYTWSDDGHPNSYGKTLHLEDRPFSDKRHDLGYDVDKKSWFPKKRRQSWWTMTRNYLDEQKNSEINVVIWSWCNIYGHTIDTYLKEMENLIQEYGHGGTKVISGERSVPVTFVFMTGHTNNDTEKHPDENKWTFTANKQIRKHCLKNNRVLYDFFDIESYDPDGKYFGDGEADPIDNAYGNYNGKLKLEDDCSYNNKQGSRSNWAEDWQNSHTEGVDWWRSGAAHSKDINGNLKGYAAWWLWARIAGWDPEK